MPRRVTWQVLDTAGVRDDLQVHRLRQAGTQPQTVIGDMSAAGARRPAGNRMILEHLDTSPKTKWFTDLCEERDVTKISRSIEGRRRLGMLAREYRHSWSLTSRGSEVWRYINLVYIFVYQVQKPPISFRNCVELLKFPCSPRCSHSISTECTVRWYGIMRFA